jgi:DNA replication protein DnaC
VARAVAGSGFSVCYESCGAAFDIYETKRFSRDSEAGDTAASKWKRMLDCDLMILDDLGTEVVTSVTQSALYELINTRLINGRKTIISSNIRPADIGKKYGPQIASRINGEFVALPFAGDDIRLRKK